MKLSPSTNLIRVRIAWLAMLAAAIAVAALLWSRERPPVEPAAAPTPSGRLLVLATTTSVQDSGLLDALLPAFERSTGIQVRVTAVGSGKALELGRLGEADAVLCHAPALEEAYVRDGYSQDRRRVASNDFVIAGPVNDPAVVRRADSGADALTRIGTSGKPFISRGDQSGTYLKEQALWRAARLQPNGEWYVSSRVGMGASLRLADERHGYILCDRSTFIAYRKKIRLELLYAGGDDLRNPYSVLVVSPQRYPATRSNEARAFADFLTGPEGQQLIGRFGVDRYGEPLFRTAAQ